MRESRSALREKIPGLVPATTERIFVIRLWTIDNRGLSKRTRFLRHGVRLAYRERGALRQPANKRRDARIFRGRLERGPSPPQAEPNMHEIEEKNNGGTIRRKGEHKRNRCCGVGAES